MTAGDDHANDFKQLCILQRHDAYISSTSMVFLIEGPSAGVVLALGTFAALYGLHLFNVGITLVALKLIIFPSTLFGMFAVVLYFQVEASLEARALTRHRRQAFPPNQI